VGEKSSKKERKKEKEGREKECFELARLTLIP